MLFHPCFGHHLKRIVGVAAMSGKQARHQ